MYKRNLGSLVAGEKHNERLEKVIGIMSRLSQQSILAGPLFVEPGFWHTKKNTELPETDISNEKSCRNGLTLSSRE